MQLQHLVHAAYAVSVISSSACQQSLLKAGLLWCRVDSKSRAHSLVRKWALYSITPIMDDLSEAAVQARFSFLGGALKWAAFKWPAFKWPASVLRQSTAVAAVDITDATDTTKFSVTEQQDSTALALTQGSSGIASSPNQGKQPDSSGATAVSVHATSIPRHNQVLPAMSIQPESLGAQQRQLAWESEATPTSAPSTVWEIQLSSTPAWGRLSPSPRKKCRHFLPCAGGA